MEELTKTQIVLLCLLVSFVTSIGTGIISYSLLQETPTAVTQTINRVVERTIEKVVPGNDKATTTQPKEIETIVVKEGDAVVSAIALAQKSIVRIEGLKENNNASSTVVSYGLGFIVAKNGTIVAHKNASIDADSYSATFPNGKMYSLTLKDDKDGLVLFTVNPTKDDASVFTPATFAATNNLALGQTVISIGGADHAVVAVGHISGLTSSIDTDIVTKDTVRGGPLVDLSGHIIGFSAEGSVGSTASFVKIDAIKAFIESIKIEQ